MRRIVASLSVVAVLAAGCTLSKVDQAATVTVRGRVLGPDGAPLVRTGVVLLKEADLGDALLGFPLMTGSLGTICLVEDPPTLCGRARRATTGADGGFSFEMRGRDTQGSAGTAAMFHVSTAMPAAAEEVQGPSVTARFNVQTTALELPELRLWRPRLTLSSVPGRLQTEWDTADGGAGSQRVVFFSGPAAEMVWAVEGRPPLTLDSRVLEDSRGTAAVETTNTEKGGGTTFHVTRRSAQRSYTGSAGAPPSRRSQCAVTGSSEGSRPAPLSPCTVTDGDLTPPERSAAGGAVTTIAVDLGTPRRLELIVVRGCPADCAIEASTDGETWTAVTSAGTPQYLAARPPAGTMAGALRVRSVADLGRLAEVSGW